MNKKNNKPTPIFEYESMCFFGGHFNIKIFSDGSITKHEINYSKLGSNENLACNNDTLQSFVDLDLTKKVEAIINANKEKLKSLPKELTNLHILDGAVETVRFGRMKFEGNNMFTENLENEIEDYKKNPINEIDDFILPLYELQKVFFEIRKLVNDYIGDEDFM